MLTAQGDTARLAKLAAIQAKIPEVTIHQDGTVTIVPAPPREP